MSGRHLLLLGCLLGLMLMAASPGVGQEIESLLDDELAETEDTTALLELLEELRTHPIDLNRATAAELRQLPWIGQELARQIVTWRSSHGPFADVAQLEQVPGVSAALAALTRPYVVASSPEGRPHLRTRPPLQLTLRTRARRRWASPTAKTSSESSGDPYRTYQRATLTFGQLFEGSALWEKDAGEERLNDFSSFYVRYAGPGPLSVVAGSFQVEAAQGLVLWGPYRFGKGGDPILPVEQTARGLRGYRSVDESAALAGVALSLSAQRLSAMVFTSDRRLDAAPLPSGGIATLDRSGYHRTTAEEAHRGMQRERLWGGRVVLHPHSRLSIGTTAFWARYSRSFERRDLRRDFFGFEGKRNHVVGIDAALAGRRTTWSAEWALSKGGGWAAILSGKMVLEGATVVAIWRRYQPDFHNLRARAFSESGISPRNEEGVYLGVRMHSNVFGEVGLAFDQFGSPWRTSTLPFPNNGQELLLRWRRRFAGLILSLRFRRRGGDGVRSVPVSVGSEHDVLARHIRQSWRLQLDYAAGGAIRLRSRVELGRFAEKLPGEPPPMAETGTLVYQQLQWRPRRGWRIEARWTGFDSRSFDSRLYALEGDLPGVWNSQVFFGRGSRWYLLALARWGHLRAGVKFAETSRLQAVRPGAKKAGTLTTRELGIYLEVQ